MRKFVIKMFRSATILFVDEYPMAGSKAIGICGSRKLGAYYFMAPKVRHTVFLLRFFTAVSKDPCK